MLTARAEYRLRLRADNAAARLTPQAIAAGCVGARRGGAHFAAGASERARMSRSSLARARSSASRMRRRRAARRSATNRANGCALPTSHLGHVAPAGRDSRCLRTRRVVQDHRYAPYVARQEAEIARLRADEAVRLPAALDYAGVPGLSNEMVERLTAARPPRSAPPARIRGVTPAALAAILVHARPQGRLMDEAKPRAWVRARIRCFT